MTVTLTFPYPGVGLLLVNRPAVRNALDWEAMAAFAAAVEQAHATPDLRVLVVSGAGRAFVAGGDLKVLAAYPEAADGRRLSAGMTRALARLEALPCPTLAAVNGPGRGGGSEIALACDLRVLAEDADLGFVQITQALTPSWGGGQRLLRLVGYSRALELLLEGQVLDAATAYALGLANRLAPPGRALEEALAWAQQIAARPPQTVRALKALLRGGFTLPPATAAALEQALFPPLWAHPDHHQAVQRFLQRGATSSQEEAA